MHQLESYAKKTRKLVIATSIANKPKVDSLLALDTGAGDGGCTGSGTGVGGDGGVGVGSGAGGSGSM